MNQKSEDARGREGIRHWYVAHISYSSMSRAVSGGYSTAYQGSLLKPSNEIDQFNASRDRGQVIHLFSEEAKQLLHPVTGLREAVCSM
jgi:hypothetical protein